MMMETTLKQLFSLLQSALWIGKLPDTNLFKDVPDWNTIFRIAKEQAIVGVLWDGIEKLPPECMPPKAVKLSWYAMVVKIEKQNEEVNRKVAEIVRCYEAEQLHPVLLKGQGLAALYPNPLHRSSGDIDIYVGLQGYERANRIAVAMGAETIAESDHHSHLVWDGIHIENHRKMALLYTKKVRTRFLNALNSWYPHSPGYIAVGSNTIPIPPYPFNPQYIFLHLYKHLLDSGVGLRQFCDLAVLLNSSEGKTVSISGHKRAWQIAGAFCTQFLGLPPEKFPGYSSRYKSKAECLLALIIEEGNFGFNNTDIYTKRPKGYLPGKLFSFRYQLKRWCKLITFLPLATLEYLFCYKLRDSLKTLIRLR